MPAISWDKLRVCEIERQTDATLINRFVNDPSIYPHVRGTHVGLFDLSQVVARAEHVVLCGEHGGVIFIKHAGGYYEAHTAVLPEGRGKWTIRLGHAVLRWMFSRTDAAEIVTKCPHGNLAAVAGARAIGARHEWTTRPIWQADEGMVPVDIYAVTIGEWMARQGRVFEASGRRFHEWLEVEGMHVEHGIDSVHDAYVGAAVEMIEAGQINKGIGFYNRWAAVSDYRPLRAICWEPPTLDIGTANLVFEKQQWRAVPCQRAA